MVNKSVFLTGDEASSLQEAIESLVSSGLQVHDSELPIPSGQGEDASDPAKEIAMPAENPLEKRSDELPPSG